MVICLERDTDLHMAQLMPLPLTVSCFSKIQIGFTFLVPAHPGSPGKRAVKRECVCVCVHIFTIARNADKIFEQNHKLQQLLISGSYTNLILLPVFHKAQNFSHK